MPKVVFVHRYEPDVARFYVEHAPPGFQVTERNALKTPEDELVELVQDADFLMLHLVPLSERVLRSARKAKLLQLVSAGYDNVDLSLTGELGIPVATVSGTNSEGVAELALALMLAVYRKIPTLDRATRQGKWTWQVITGFDCFEVAGKTVGIVGLGRIGRLLARRLMGFDATLLGYDVAPPHPEEAQYGIRRVGLDDLLRESDIVSLHVPLVPQTHHLIGRRELSLMKPTAVLINTARGEVVDEEALIEALQNGQIAGAGLDVFHQEPVSPDNPLLKMENVVVTPHVAGSTAESWPRRAQLAYSNMQRVLRGEEPVNLVHP